jgi:hypothetical protein
MPALIVFSQRGSSSGDGDGKSSRARPEQVRVTETPAAVLKKLEASKNGFVDVTPENNPKKTFWINGEHIRIVRDV